MKNKNKNGNRGIAPGLAGELRENGGFSGLPGAAAGSPGSREAPDFARFPRIGPGGARLEKNGGLA